MLYQIQPQYMQGDAYLQFAQEEGFRFEVLELSMPPLLQNEKEASYAMDWYKASGLVESVHGAFIDMNPSSGNKVIKEHSRDMYKKSCELAKELGAKNVIFHCGAFPYLRDQYIEKFTDSSAAFYADLVREFDLNICIENALDIDAYPICSIVDKAADSRVRACLDIGHANYTRHGVENWFRDLGDRIGYIHLSGNLGQFDDHLALGQGNIPWDKANALFKGLNKEVPITFETGNIAQTKTSIAFLQNHHYFGK